VKLVLDTNVVIDWLVFDDPYLNPLRLAVQSGHAIVYTAEAAISELRRVLAYRELKLDAARQSDVMSRYLAATLQLTETTPQSAMAERLPTGFPRCRDPDDDPFVALAFFSRADALVSRDKAVLKLKRRCARFGVNILDVQALVAAIERSVADTPRIGPPHASS